MRFFEFALVTRPAVLFSVLLTARFLATEINADEPVASEQKTAGEKFKSVSVLANMPADQMGKVMNIMSASLGVNCGHCHEGTNFAKDSVGQKELARKMLSMTFELNERSFGGEPKITCNTCHRGQARPASTLSLAPHPPGPSAAASFTHPSTDEIWARYLAALGGKDRVAALKTRHVIANRVEPNGKREPEELWQTSQGKSRMVTQYGTLAVVEGFDGDQAWKRANDSGIALKPDEAEQIRTEAIVAFGMQMVSHYRELSYQKGDRVQDRDCHVLEGKIESHGNERLFFDVLSGLLLRRIASVPTILGPFEYQVDYQDYQEFGGVLQPTKLRFAVPNISWTRQVSSIETNIDLDESQFRLPYKSP